MGNQGKSYALVSMTNKDTYYVTVQTGKWLLSRLSDPGQSPFVDVTDIKNGTSVLLSLNHISSVVVKEDE